jgi:hypothetical protein
MNSSNRMKSLCMNEILVIWSLHMMTSVSVEISMMPWKSELNGSWNRKWCLLITTFDRYVWVSESDQKSSLEMGKSIFDPRVIVFKITQRFFREIFIDCCLYCSSRLPKMHSKYYRIESRSVIVFKKLSHLSLTHESQPKRRLSVSSCELSSFPGQVLLFPPNFMIASDVTSLLKRFLSRRSLQHYLHHFVSVFDPRN